MKNLLMAGLLLTLGQTALANTARLTATRNCPPSWAPLAPARVSLSC